MESVYHSDVCIVGLGPAGLGVISEFLARQNDAKIICVEMGDTIDDRFCSLLEDDYCTHLGTCSLIQGEGGASLFGGHKISYFPAGSELALILGSEALAKEEMRNALSTLQKSLKMKRPQITPTDIEKAKEHYHRNGFVFKYYDSYTCSRIDFEESYKTMFKQMDARGITRLIKYRLMDVDKTDKGFLLTAQNGSKKVEIQTRYLVLALGRTGQLFLRKLNDVLKLGGSENHLELGIRLEFPTEICPDIDIYHNDLKLLYKRIRTFCVCKNGKLAPYILDGTPILDGYYDPVDETELTNLAIMLRLNEADDNISILSDVKNRVLQEGAGRPIRQKYLDYINEMPHKETSSLSQTGFCKSGNINSCFPSDISSELKEGVEKFVSSIIPKDKQGEIHAFAPAIEYSWMRFPVAKDFSTVSGVYLIGDCTGRFRGILQAFCSGKICADSIIAKLGEKK